MDTDIGRHTPATAQEALESLPEVVSGAILELGEQFHGRGLRLFLFGSWAEGTARATSDLDIGIEWVDERDSVIYHELASVLEGLPTIRKVDLVDFSYVDETFRRAANRKKLYL